MQPKGYYLLVDIGYNFGDPELAYIWPFSNEPATNLLGSSFNVGWMRGMSICDNFLSPQRRVLECGNVQMTHP